MKKFLFYLVQFTWALPQNLVGGIGFLALRKKYKHERFNNAFVTYVPHDNFGGVSLGIFIFMNPDRPADRVRSEEQSTTHACMSTATPFSRFCSAPSGLL